MAAATKAAPKRRPGRPHKLSDEQMEAARERYLAGDTPREIAPRFGVAARTVRGWARRYGWDKQLRDRRQTASQIEGQIAKLSQGTPTARKTDQIAKLTKALERMRRMAPKPKPRPTIRDAVHKDLLARVLEPDYGLYLYQRDFLTSEARFRLIKKARQIGFSFALGLAVVLGAMAGRPQLIVSASELQSQIVLGYARGHCVRLEIPLDDDQIKSIRVGGVEIRALPANPRTIQGFAGDVWLDEYAWHHKPKRIWNAVVPSITQVGGRLTICSTPFLPGNHFWELAENHKGRWGQFERSEINIHAAVAQGMPLPGGIEELRGLFDAESWAMLYECQYAEDGAALLPWALLHEIATAEEIRTAWDGPVDVGADIGQVHDKFSYSLFSQEAELHSMLFYESHRGLSFEQMRGHLVDVHRRYFVRRMTIDRTGLGRQLAQEMVSSYSGNTLGRDFSAPFKERIALNLKLLAERKQLAIINDPYLLSRFHAIKQRVTGSGIRYDAASDSEGHADEFWAAAMALDGHARHAGRSGVKVEIWS